MCFFKTDGAEGNGKATQSGSALMGKEVMGMKWIVDIHGEIEGDYELICKYEERPKGERKTGKWIDESVVTGTTDGGTTLHRQYRCSVCGNLFGRIDDKFCGRCGARMEGEP